MDGSATVCLRLIDVVERIKRDLTLSPARRRDLVSAVMRICQLTAVDPKVTPASLSYMRPLIKKVRPARHNLRRKTWSNLRANFRAAIVAPLPHRPRDPNTAWETLRRALPNPRMKERLSRFIGYCDREGIAPGDVCDAVLHNFGDYLENRAQVWSPHDCLRLTCKPALPFAPPTKRTTPHKSQFSPHLANQGAAAFLKLTARYESRERL